MKLAFWAPVMGAWITVKGLNLETFRLSNSSITGSFSVQAGRELFAGKQSSEKERFPRKYVITDGHFVCCGRRVKGRVYSTNDA